MTRSEITAKKISEKIKTWSKGRDKLVIAIDGYAGSGKTTIAGLIAKQNHDVLTVHEDDFIRHWKQRKRMIERNKDKSKVFAFHWYRYDDLKTLVCRFKTKNKGSMKIKTYNYEKNDFGPKKLFDLSKKILVIEGVFLLHPKNKIIGLFDKTIYLESDFAKADKKRIMREKKRWGKNYVPETHPDNWAKYFKKAYGEYAKKYRVQSNRDMVI